MFREVCGTQVVPPSVVLMIAPRQPTAYASTTVDRGHANEAGLRRRGLGTPGYSSIYGLRLWSDHRPPTPYWHRQPKRNGAEFPDCWQYHPDGGVATTPRLKTSGSAARLSSSNKVAASTLLRYLFPISPQPHASHHSPPCVTGNTVSPPVLYPIIPYRHSTPMTRLCPWSSVIDIPLCRNWQTDVTTRLAYSQQQQASRQAVVLPLFGLDPGFMFQHQKMVRKKSIKSCLYLKPFRTQVTSGLRCPAERYPKHSLAMRVPFCVLEIRL